jgi:hypothetical protein
MHESHGRVQGDRDTEPRVNCEYVSSDVDEDGQQTVMVRTTRDVCTGEEFFAHFGEQFTTVLSTGCECCACTRATAECREIGTRHCV